MSAYDVMAAMHGDPGRAVKAIGVFVRVEPADFVRILNRQPESVVIHASGGLFRRLHHYTTSYKGFAFLVTCSEPLPLDRRVELFEAKALWTPV